MAFWRSLSYSSYEICVSFLHRFRSSAFPYLLQSGSVFVAMKSYIAAVEQAEVPSAVIKKIRNFIYAFRMVK